MAIKHKSEAPPDARDTNPLVPEPLVRVIYRCLQKSPADRYPDADALAAVAVEVFSDDRVFVEPELPEALDRAMGLAEEAGEYGGAGVLVTGSVVLVGDVRRLLGGPASDPTRRED